MINPRMLLFLQIAYSELFVTPILWPDFNTAALVEALVAYASRQRRFGLTGDQTAAAVATPAAQKAPAPTLYSGYSEAYVAAAISDATAAPSKHTPLLAPTWQRAGGVQCAQWALEQALRVLPLRWVHRMAAAATPSSRADSASGSGRRLGAGLPMKLTGVASLPVALTALAAVALCLGVLVCGPFLAIGAAPSVLGWDCPCAAGPAAPPCADVGGALAPSCPLPAPGDHGDPPGMPAPPPKLWCCASTPGDLAVLGHAAAGWAHSAGSTCAATPLPGGRGSGDRRSSLSPVVTPFVSSTATGSQAPPSPPLLPAAATAAAAAVEAPAAAAAGSPRQREPEGRGASPSDDDLDSGDPDVDEVPVALGPDWRLQPRFYHRGGVSDASRGVA